MGSGVAHAVKTYVAPARSRHSPLGGGWELHIDGIGLTQMDKTGPAVEQVRDFVKTVSLGQIATLVGDVVK